MFSESSEDRNGHLFRYLYTWKVWKPEGTREDKHTHPNRYRQIWFWQQGTQAEPINTWVFVSLISGTDTAHPGMPSMHRVVLLCSEEPADQALIPALKGCSQMTRAIPNLPAGTEGSQPPPQTQRPHSLMEISKSLPDTFLQLLNHWNHLHPSQALFLC